MAIGIILIALVSIGCSNDSEAGEHSSGSEGGMQSGLEHSSDSEGGEHDGWTEEGEESGVLLALSETFDEVRAGARLILSYNSTDNLFKGTVRNTTESTLRRVRVEVHLSNGTELGPTPPADIEPWRVINVVLTATGDDFTSWSAHAEVD